MKKREYLNREYLNIGLNNRFVIIIIALTLQLLAFIGVILRFYKYFAFFYAGSIIVSLLAVLFILNNRSNPVYKIAWIIPILIFPIFGGLFYIFFGVNRLSKRKKHSMRFISEKTQDTIHPRPEIVAEIESLNNNAGNQSRYIQNYSYYPPYRNTYCEYLPSGEQTFAKLKEELQKARHYIFLEYFIIEEGIMWNSILEILIAKVKEGVEVRVIYDDLGCLVKLPYNYSHKLEELGIKCAVFNPVIPVLSPHHNNRDHRKIAIIDGQTAFTGGVNLADEYINAKEKYGHWKDSAIMLKGEAAWSLTVMFLTMWGYLKGIDEDYKQFKIPPGQFKEKEKDVLKGGDSKLGFVQPFADSPLDNEPVGETIYFNLINKAQKYVYITTPYLIINNEIITALTTAAKSGVDVRIITPYIPDKWYVHAVTRSYYKILLEEGIRIYEYTPGFIHSKTFVADHEYGVVGTINMDYRSLFLHFECGVWLYGCGVIKDMYNDFINTLEKCQEITLQDLQRIHWYKKLLGFILRIFAPLM
ncbi:MAG TPA: cardiolipin synthase [Peptococcaceae bacterium]|nr:cardiolipin synthase [Peptococcaceae bacterium]